MKQLTDTLIAVMAVAILAGMVLYHRQEHRFEKQVQIVHESLYELQEQLVYQAALAEVELNPSGFPLRIRPEWFGQKRPHNPLVAAEQQWLDVAEAMYTADHPPDPVVLEPRQSAFWYNPNVGIIRARVPARLTDQETIEMYNRVNGSDLKVLMRPPPSDTKSELNIVVSGPNEHKQPLKPSLSPRPTLIDQQPVHYRAKLPISSEHQLP